MRRLVELAVVDPRPHLIQRIAWALQHERDLAAQLLDGELRGADPARAQAARAIYKELTARTPDEFRA